MNVMITGHRPQYMTPPEQRVTKATLRQLLERLKLRHPNLRLLTGMAIGADQWSAESALVLGIPVVAAIPFKGQESRWSSSQQEHYHHLLSQCSETHILFDGPYSPHMFLMRNQWLVDHANLALVVWGGAQSGGTWDAVKRIRKAGLPHVVTWRGALSKHPKKG